MLFRSVSQSRYKPDKRNKLLAKICTINAAVFAPPVAKNDISTTLVNVAVSNLVTLNDFATSNVVVTITTAPINGTAVVQPDGKTIIYTPETGFVGNDTVGYTITDANGQTSTAIWTIIVNAVPAVSCSTVLPQFNASLYSVGANLQITFANQSDYGTNVATSESYLIQIRDSSDLVLYSYTATGSTTTDPTIWTSPIPIASTWHNVNITLTTASESATGVPCGAVVTTVNYSLANISVSWFDGTTPPACLNFLIGDNEIEKKDKLMNKVCSVSTQVDANTAAIAVIPNPADYIDISSGATVVSPFVLLSLKVLEYASGRVVVDGRVSYPSTVGRDADIITGLPVNANINEGIFHARLQGDTDAIAQLRIYGTGGIIRNGISTLPDLNATANTEMVFHYEYQKG